MVRGRQWGIAAAVVGAVSVFGPACGQAQVDAVVVWLDAEISDGQPRAIQIYDRGVRRRVELDPTIDGTLTGNTRILVDPRARGLAVAGVGKSAVWIDLDTAERGRVGPGPWGELGEDLVFARSGLALAYLLSGVNAGGAVLLPIGGARSEPLWLSPPTSQAENPSWVLRSASDAPIVFVAEVTGGDDLGPTRVDGTIAAYAFPAIDHRGSGGGLEQLGRATMRVRGIDPAAYPQRISSGWCGAGLCVSPEGDAAIGPSNQPCTLMRWRWAKQGSDGQARPPVELALPSACELGTEPFALAALTADRVLLGDEQRLYLADLGRGTWSALPRLGLGTGMIMLPAAGGRRFNLVTTEGQLMRADEDGLSVVNAEQTSCAQLVPPITSPDGGWVLMSCVGDPSGIIIEMQPREIASIVRISALGLERFDGIAMAPLAIDDGGNALLYSFDPDDDDRSPRGLFVLDAHGDLARVDDLEPEPQLFIGAGGAGTYFARAADWPGGGGR